MKFGYFDDANKEYVITSPKTPLPWINYLGSENFFSLISNTCGGYSFYKDAKLLRLTRYRYNNVPFDSNGHYYYIKEGDTIWNPGWMPAKTDLDAYECHHGMGYSTFRSSKNDLQAELTAFVPVGKNCEINQLTLTNNSKETKDFSVFSYVEFCLWNAMDDMTNFQRNFSTGEVEVHGSAIYHKTEYRERRNHYALYAVNAPVDGFDTDRDSFLGAYGENSAPEVVVSDQSKNSIASGWAPVGSHHLKVSLAPGESKTFVFILAYIENPVEEKWIGRAEDGKINRTRAEALMKEFDTKEKSEAALAELKKYWDELLSHFTVSSSEEKLDRMVNIWHQYQCMVTFNMSRSASYFESGIGRGMGFRDSCQDLLGFVHLIPDRARERILDIAATQFEDGSAYHQYQPLTKKGNSDIGSGFNDDPLWLIAGTAAYIKETGDYTILDEKTPYDSDPSKATDFMEHLRRSFHYTIDHLGPHKLPLIGRADWNDCLRLGADGESTFVALQFYYAMTILKEFAAYKKDDEYIAYLDESQEKLGKIIQELCWNEDRFIRGFTGDGQVIGKRDDPEANMWLNPQSWAVISGFASDEQADKALEMVYERLNTEYGAILMDPPYHAHAFDGALAVIYNAGTKENAGIFSQSQGWIILAEALKGHGDRAFKYFIENAPAAQNDRAEIRRLEPYCYGQFTEGKASPNFGRSHVHWLTGTASTVMVGCVEGILGMRPDFYGLHIAPSIPKAWDGFEIEKDFRGCHLHIVVKNPDHVESGCKSLLVNGQAVEGDYIPKELLSEQTEIELTM